MIYLYFSKAEIKLQGSNKILMGKWMNTGWSVRWTEKWLNYQAWSTVIHSMRSSWMPVTSGVPPGVMLRLLLFSIFINALSPGTQCTAGEFTGAVTDRVDGCAAIHGNLDRLQQWADRNLVKFSKVKFKEQHQGTKKTRHQRRLGAEPAMCHSVLVRKTPTASWAASRRALPAGQGR